jgi:Mg-chelatase subunit ChlD
MIRKVIAIAIFTLTIVAVVGYPKLYAGNAGAILTQTTNQTVTEQSRPVVDVVFVLDTTGSMSGLIQAAKDKIWSIASTMASAQPVPELRIGLVAYRDRGDAYVTHRVDLSDDLDSVYAALMDFQAGGGGDTPESVNRALYEAVHDMSWSEKEQAYQVIFLVGDAPPHMDYNEMQYPAIVAAANERGIVINTIQCGDLPTTIGPWTAIANLGQGSFFQVEQNGNAVAFESPYDAEIAKLSAKLDATRLYYGSAEEREQMEVKLAATEKLAASAPVASLARRGVFNVGEGGRTNLLGEKELVEAVATGEVALADIDADALPEALKPMAAEEQAEFVQELAEERADLKRQIQDLARERDEFMAQKVEEAGGLEDSLDKRLYDVVKKQAGKVGFVYADDAPAY